MGLKFQKSSLTMVQIMQEGSETQFPTVVSITLQIFIVNDVSQ